MCGRQGRLLALGEERGTVLDYREKPEKWGETAEAIRSCLLGTCMVSNYRYLKASETFKRNFRTGRPNPTQLLYDCSSLSNWRCPKMTSERPNL